MQLVGLFILLLGLTFNVKALEMESGKKKKVLYDVVNHEMKKPIKERNLDKIVSLSEALCNEFDQKRACLIAGSYCRDTKYKRPYNCGFFFKQKSLELDKCNDPNNYKSCLAQAFTLSELGRHKEASQLFLKFRKKMNDYDENNYGTVLEALGRKKEAKKLFESSCSKKNMYGCFNVAVNLAKAKEYTQALNWLKVSVSLGYHHKRFLLKDRRTEVLRRNPKILKFIMDMK